MATLINSIVLEKGLRTEFVKAYDNGEKPAEIMPVVMETVSTSNKEKYGWLGQVPGLVEWKDERKIKSVGDYQYEIPNKDFEATLSVDRNEIEDDQIGNVKIRIQDLARKALIFPRKLFFDALVAGTSGLCYDGQAFFSASHVEGLSGTQSNIVTGTGTTVAQFMADFESARSRMRGFKDDQGEPYNEGEMMLYVVCAPALEGVVDQVLTADLISSTTNTLKGAAKKIVSGRLTGNSWYLLAGNGVIKPLVLQKRKAPAFTSLEGESERGFMRKEYLYGVDCRYGFGYGLWQKAVKVSQ